MERIQNGYGTDSERIQNGYRMGTGMRVERKQNTFGHAFPVRFLLIGTVTQQLTFLHFYKLNSVIKTLLFLDLSLDNRVRFQADIKSLQNGK